MIANLIKDGVVAIGKTKLCILHLEVGTHSIRSGAAMAMYLARVPVFSIMLIDDDPAQPSSSSSENKFKNSHVKSHQKLSKYNPSNTSKT
jgi:hypothetical protein